MTKLQYHSTPPSPVSGDSIEPQCDSRGNTKVSLASGATSIALVSASNGSDGQLGSTTLIVTNQAEAFNGTNWDRVRNNMDATILASAARTATTNSADIVNYNGRGLHLVIDVTAIAATPSVVFTIQGKDVLSGQYYTLLVSAAITAVGTTVLRVFPAATAAANTVANDILPRTWRVNAVHADGDSITYSVGASVIL